MDFVYVKYDSYLELSNKLKYRFDHLPRCIVNGEVRHCLPERSHIKLAITSFV